MDFQKFLSGGVFDAYEYFGAHMGKAGVTFRIYAPNAQKVELQGDFNGWDGSGRVHVYSSGGVCRNVL